MPPSQGNNPNFGAQITTRVPASVKTGTRQLSKELHAADAIQNVNQSKVLRWALYRMILNEWDDLPEDVRQHFDVEYLERQLADMPTLNEESDQA